SPDSGAYRAHGPRRRDTQLVAAWHIRNAHGYPGNTGSALIPGALASFKAGHTRESMSFDFTLHATHDRARRGTLTTPHGAVETPALAFVATQATVKAMDAAALETLGVQLVIANTYHLYLRPGPETVAALGGLH